MHRNAVRRFARAGAALVAALVVGAGLLVEPANAHPRPPEDRAGYVAMGDSYASGEGLPPFADGTVGPGQCHRSVADSYPVRLTESGRRSFGDLTSVACSGAITADLLATRPGTTRAPQIAALTARTRTVTVTVGGNDAGFGLIFADCVYSPDAQLAAALPGRPGCADRDEALVSARIAALSGTPGAPSVPGVVPLPTAVGQIAAAAPKATIYLTGYPSIFGRKTTNRAGCLVSSQAPLFVTGSDAAWIRSKAAELNRVIKTTAALARARGMDVRYVDAARAFRGHDLCDARSPWLNGVVLSSLAPPQISPATFHPTERGQRAYADAVLDERHRRPGRS